MIHRRAECKSLCWADPSTAPICCGGCCRPTCSQDPLTPSCLSLSCSCFALAHHSQTQQCFCKSSCFGPGHAKGSWVLFSPPQNTQKKSSSLSELIVYKSQFCSRHLKNLYILAEHVLQSLDRLSSVPLWLLMNAFHSHYRDTCTCPGLCQT